MTFEQIIYISNEEKKILDNRYCDNNCGTKITRGKRMGIEQWINTKYCCKMCMLSHRKEVGMVFENKEYKCRAFSSKKDTFGITVPRWFHKKYNLKNCYFNFETANGKCLMYVKTKKTKCARKIVSSGYRDYMQISIPSKIVKEFNLKEKLFKFEEINGDVLFYTEI